MRANSTCYPTPVILRPFQVSLCAVAIFTWLLFSWTGVTARYTEYKPVARELIEARLRRYPGNDKQRQQTLKQMFTEAGCDGENLSEQLLKGSKSANVICVLPGNSDKIIIVGAHYDHVSAGDGVVDNWSGASLLPSLYESAKIVPRKHSYIFIGFAEEEQGELGSHFYARQMTKEQVTATEAMVNMDTLGLAPTETWASHSDKRLNAAAFYVAKQMNLPISGVNVDQIGSTDSEQFAERKIPSITIHSLNQESWDARILHSSKDKISAIRLDDYYQSYRLIAAYIAFLDEFAGSQPAPTPH